MSFDTAFTELVDIEKGYSNDPSDPGNWTGGDVNSGDLKGTNYGISAAAYPTLDIQNLTLTKAKDLYRTDYWNAIKADALPDVIASALFKMAVNEGVKTAVKSLQRSLKTEDDGTVGQLTIGLATQQPPAIVLENFLAECGKEYMGFKNFPKYGAGWIRRLIKTALQANVAH